MCISIVAISHHNDQPMYISPRLDIGPHNEHHVPVSNMPRPASACSLFQFVMGLGLKKLIKNIINYTKYIVFQTSRNSNYLPNSTIEPDSTAPAAISIANTPEHSRILIGAPRALLLMQYLTIYGKLRIVSTYYTDRG